MNRRSVLDRHIRLSSSTLGDGVDDASPITCAVTVTEDSPAAPQAPEPRRKRPPKGKKPFTARDMLEIWALRREGSRMKSPLRRITGGLATNEEEGQIVDYVETTPGFLEAKQVLRHVYGKEEPDSTFDPRRPGETLEYALGRLGWKRFLGRPLYKIGYLIHREFMEALELRMATEPFVFVPQLPEDDQGPLTEGEKAQMEAIRESLRSFQTPPRKKEKIRASKQSGVTS